MTLEYLISTGSTHRLGDHLGSTSLTTDTTGAKVSETRYEPWGEIRYSWTSGQSTTPAYKLPVYTFTGQRSDSYINLLWYGSRHYDPELGRFIQPDSIVPNPGNPQAYNRYSYAFDNPVKYTDPSGHTPVCGSTYSDPECEKQTTIDPPSEEMTIEVLHTLAGGDENIYQIWLKLYYTQAAHTLAMNIYKNGVRMEFWGNIHSETQCFF